MSIQDCDSVSSLTSLSSDTFEDDLFFPATEFVSEDNSSVNHQFVNDNSVASMLSVRELHSDISTGSAASINSSDSSSSIDSITEIPDIQVNMYAEVNFALTLSFTRTPRLSRNGEDVICIHKRNRPLKTRE